MIDVMIPRLRHGLADPSDPISHIGASANIYVKIRERYGLSRAAMGKVLGFGVNQWRIYEDGLEPKKSHQLLIVIVSSPRSFRNMLVVNNGPVIAVIGIKRYAKLLGKVRDTIREFEKLEDDRYDKWVRSLWV